MPFEPVAQLNALLLNLLASVEGKKELCIIARGTFGLMGPSHILGVKTN
jgi:hypothetical protein